jgi:hypothetical protein
VHTFYKACLISGYPYTRRVWEIELATPVEQWYLELVSSDPGTAALVEQAIDRLAEAGPMLGRPLVDRIKQSRHHNMKELRPASTGASEVRILFVFDPCRTGLLLLAGDKAGQWNRWYEQAIPVADRRYDEHLAQLAEKEGTS